MLKTRRNFSSGTFGNTTGLANASSCLPCLPGFYCPTTGLQEPFKKCTAGYWCIEASVETAPDQQVYGTRCPNGSYCPEGTPAPIKCPKGTYQPFLQKTELLDCRCKFAYFCLRESTLNIEFPVRIKAFYLKSI